MLLCIKNNFDIKLGAVIMKCDTCDADNNVVKCKKPSPCKCWDKDFICGRGYRKFICECQRKWPEPPCYKGDYKEQDD
ncbi:MAG: hypothetical protein A2Y17_00840 [Clostridiales bacterium GWF2_38_85]|nr:MAG: hypothetical protein A2Y17_00840 [Clostridiales bacterium GWF2_38_85]